jgi:response regulator RpfG family c-di-GMP phosphodiesterase
MNNMIFYSFTPSVKFNSLRVCYLDNQEEHLQHFIDSFDTSQFANYIPTTDPDLVLNLADSKEVDVFISDFKMPYQDGISVLKRCLEKDPKAKAILFTGYTVDQKSQDECRKYGIRRVNKLETEAIGQTISLVANELVSFDVPNKRWFTKQKVDFVNKRVDIIEKPNANILKEKVMFVREVNQASQSELVEAFHDLAYDLIEDIRKLAENNEVEIYLSDDMPSSAKEILFDLENITPRGLTQIKNWIAAKAFIKKEMDKLANED